MRKKVKVTKRGLLSLIVLLALPLLVLGGKTLSSLKPQSDGQNEEVKNLLRIISDDQLRETEPGRVIEAIKTLGEMKSIAAIDGLIHLITYKRTYEWEKYGYIHFHPITTFDRYPAAGALFEIGRASLPGLKKVIETEETGSLASENAIYTVIQVFRDSPLEGVQHLKDAAVKTTSVQAAERLSAAADKMKRFLQQ